MFMAAKQPHFSPKQVAAALQASESSVKRWCDRGAIETTRTVGGHRRITLEALQSFLRESKWAIRVPGELGLEAKHDLARIAVKRGLDRDQQSFLAALVRGEEAVCRRRLRQKLQSGCPRGKAAEYLITAGMRVVGDAWQCKEIDAYHERRACDICIRLINQLRTEQTRIPEWGPVAIGGTLSGDHFQVATSLVELSLRDAGWNASNLGSNLPAESFLRAAKEYQPQVVWLSVSHIEDDVSFAAEYARLADGLDNKVSLIIGGRALTSEIRKRLSHTAYFENISGMIQLSSMMNLQR